MAQLLPGRSISSAGVDALVGQDVDESAAGVAREKGLAVEGHVARQLTPELCRASDLILPMSNSIMQQVFQISPESRGKVMLFGKWSGDLDIPDPYRKSKEAHEQTYTLIAEAAQYWADKLSVD